MVDRYIDYDEVSEYGKHFIHQLPSLAGQSDLVNLAKLDALVSNAISAVEIELQKTSGDRSDLRGERVGTVEATLALRDCMSRFYYFLRSLPASTPVDFQAFFAGNTMGDLGNLKPADLEAKAADVLRGFDATQNKGLSALTPWKSEIANARQTLFEALAGKGNATGKAFVATAALVDARKNFLQAYNKVAKPIVRGLLAQLGRENEYTLFFKDLTVNEGGPAHAPAVEPPPAPPATP